MSWKRLFRVELPFEYSKLEDWEEASENVDIEVKPIDDPAFPDVA